MPTNKAFAGSLKDLKDSQDKAAHARRDAGTSASQGQAGLGQITSGSTGSAALDAALGGLASITSGLLSGAVKTASGMETLVDNVADRQRDTLEDQQTELKNTKMDLNKTKEDWENESLAVTQLLVTKTVQVEKGVSLLTQKQSLLERVCRNAGMRRMSIPNTRKRSRSLALAQAQTFPRKSLPFPRARRSCKVPRTA